MMSMTSIHLDSDTQAKVEDTGIGASAGGFQFTEASIFCFQAEDGIRDSEVTGVQTCALPISSRRRHTSELQSPQNLVCRLLLDIRRAHVCTPVTSESRMPSSASTHSTVTLHAC